MRYHDAKRADGLILLGYGDYSLYSARIEQLVAQGAHFARWGSIRSDRSGATVGSDNLGAGRLAGEHLLECGRRNIAFLGHADEHYPEFEHRYDGLCEALRAAGIAPDPSLQFDALTNEEAGYRAASALIAGGARFDAIFAASDLIAIGAMRALAGAGLTIPRDVAVVGFDNIPAASLTTPPLTTIQQDIAGAGRAAGRDRAGPDRGPRPARAAPAQPADRARQHAGGLTGSHSYAPCRRARGMRANRRRTRPRRAAQNTPEERGVPMDQTAAPKAMNGAARDKPRQGFAGLWNISFGFFGLQIGFALQNANMSRVLQTLGSSIDDLPVLWVAAPLTGLVVQPIIGHLSDRTWNRLGRRRPYFAAGASLAALSLLLMPLAPLFAAPLVVAALTLWVLDASLNIAMEPFRAFVGDMLRTDQHAAGYAVQTALIGAGAVVGSIFPFLLERLGVANVAADGGIPDTVKWSFWAGGAALIAAVLWTVVTTREYSPEEMARFGGETAPDETQPLRALAAKSHASSVLWIGAGVLIALSVDPLALQKEIYLLAGLLAVYGVLSAIAIAMAKRGRAANMLSSIVGDFSGMSPVMKRLALVQFFSWSALFIMWINTTPVVTQYVFGSTDPGSAVYNEGPNWVNVLFTVYNGVAAVAALALLPWLSRRAGPATTHSLCLALGALGFLMIFFVRDAITLLIAEVGIGIAWASILAMPYAILASNLPQAKLGIYMGLFNIFIVVPQLLAATVMGSVMQAFFPGEPIWTMLFAAASWLIAALAMQRVKAAL